jgi:hypothetical protein
MKWLNSITVGILILVLPGWVYFYYYTAIAISDVRNSDITAHDQEAMINFAKLIHNTATAKRSYFTGTRNRMPLYQHNLTDEDFFQLGKRINIILTIILLILTCLIVKVHLPLHAAINVALVTAIGVWINIAGSFEPEILYYFLAFAAFILMSRSIHDPNVVIMLVTGAIVAFAFLTKASIIPSIPLFIACFLLFDLRSYRKPASLLKRVVLLISFLAAFAAIAGPYLLQSERKYGSYFYNVNQFYFWCDSWGEAKKFSHDYGDRYSAVSSSDPNVPSLRKYFREHSYESTFQRLGEGFLQEANVFFMESGGSKYLIWFSGVLLVCSYKFPALLVRRCGKYWPIIIFTSIYFVEYILLYSWFARVNQAPRFCFSLFLPSVFVLTFAIENAGTEPKVSVSNRKFAFITIVRSITTGMCLVDSWLIYLSVR